jgi:hypothetical protein
LNPIITMRGAKNIKEAERLAKRENRTMSELIGEALKQYQDRPARSEGDDLRTVIRIIEEARKNPMSPEELRAENARLMAYGARQAKKAGIKERDIPDVIHASRASRRAS